MGKTVSASEQLLQYYTSLVANVDNSGSDNQPEQEAEETLEVGVAPDEGEDGDMHSPQLQSPNESILVECSETPTSINSLDVGNIDDISASAILPNTYPNKLIQTPPPKPPKPHLKVTINPIDNSKFTDKVVQHVTNIPLKQSAVAPIVPQPPSKPTLSMPTSCSGAISLGNMPFSDSDMDRDAFLKRFIETQVSVTQLLPHYHSNLFFR